MTDLTAGTHAIAALSGHLDTRTAGTEVAEILQDGLGGRCDLALVFASFHHIAALPEAVETIRATINPSTILAVTAESVLGEDQELEGVAGMTALALRLPGVRLTPWMTTPEDPMPLRHARDIADRIGLSDDFRAAILLAEPFSSPIVRLLPALTSCGGPNRPVPVVGGMASGASQPGHNVLILDDVVTRVGAIGVSLAGDLDIDFVVSQGCRPVGSTLKVTKVKENVILQLDGEPAMKALQVIADAAGEEERQLLQRGLLIGNVIDESKSHVGRGDFLVRNILGFEQQQGGIVVGDLPRLGQHVQFHVRDSVTAAEDLQLLLDAQELSARPMAGLLISCNGRGKRLFGEPNHDVSVIADRLGPLPMAGFFAAGEFGPLGARSFLHGHTASLALFRKPAGG